MTTVRSCSARAATGNGGTGLEVLRLPSMTLAGYPAPSGCRFQALAGDGTALDALLQCGSARQLSVVAIAPGTFTVTTTLARLGVCLGGETLSLVPGDPSAMLAETYAGCLRPGASDQQSTPPPSGQDSIVTIRGGQVWRVVIGPAGAAVRFLVSAWAAAPDGRGSRPGMED